MAKHESKKESKTLRFIDIFTGLMIFIIAGAVPLATYGFVLDLPPDLAFLSQHFGATQTYDDFLAYAKNWIFCAAAGLIVFYFVSDLVTGGLKNMDFKKIIRTPAVIAVLVYLLMAVLSSVFSQYRNTALFGTRDRHEGIITLFAFMAAFIASIYYFRSEKFLTPLFAGLIFSSVIMGAIGLGQMFGKDFFSIPFVQELVKGKTSGVDLQFNIAFGTLFNPNTYGLYSAMLSPFLLICGFTYKGRRWVNVLLIIAGALMLSGVPASNSLGGLVGAAAAAAVLIITFIAHAVYNKKRPPKAVWISASAALVLLLAAFLFVPTLRVRMTGFAQKFYVSMVMGGERPNDYAFEGGKFKIMNADGADLAVLEFGESPWLTVTDGGGNEVAPHSIVYEETAAEEDERNDADPYKATVDYSVPGYGILSLNRQYGYTGVTGYADNNNFTVFVNYENGRVLPLLSDVSTLDVDAPVASIGFEDNEKFASMRGYIWSRAFPLMLKTPLLGTGPDSFVNEFPNYDVIGKLRAYGNLFMTVDKAHNVYIQTWITTGGISALALIFLYGFYIVTTFLSLVKSKGEERSTFGLRLGLLAGISAYCVSSMSTDTTAPSTGVFYVLLGLGYAVNMWSLRKAGLPSAKNA